MSKLDEALKQSGYENLKRRWRRTSQHLFDPHVWRYASCITDPSDYVQ